MPDYDRYIKAAGISEADFAGAISAKYPGFGEAQAAMLRDGARCGLQLMPGAEEALCEAFGPHPGLAACKAAKKPRPARTKPHCLAVYLPDETNERLRALMRRRGYATVQDFLCSLLTRLAEREAAPDQGALLLAARQRLGLTQEQLAALLFISQQSVSNYELGRTRLPDDLRRRLEELLNEAQG